ncbi:unnamed protein product [Larinioides sclopetarius]|uniref:Uncharacterized protein n=1 Tax=Larinioides sclopetarius TaxID=280406 RepID=A0AAV2BIU2_9ARAC
MNYYLLHSIKELQTPVMNSTIEKPLSIMVTRQ